MSGTEKPDLAEWIKANPGAKFVIDNDGWTAYPANPKLDGYGDAIGFDEDDFREERGYPYHNLYGGGILSALARLQGVETEGC